MQNKNEKHILEIIETLQNGDGSDEQITLWMENELSDYPDILDLIFYTMPDASAEEILEFCKKDRKIYL